MSEQEFLHLLIQQLNDEFPEAVFRFQHVKNHGLFLVEVNHQTLREDPAFNDACENLAIAFNHKFPNVSISFVGPRETVKVSRPDDIVNVEQNDVIEAEEEIQTEERKELKLHPFFGFVTIVLIALAVYNWKNVLGFIGILLMVVALFAFCLLIGHIVYRILFK